MKSEITLKELNDKGITWEEYGYLYNLVFYLICKELKNLSDEEIEKACKPSLCAEYNIYLAKKSRDANLLTMDDLTLKDIEV